MSFVSAASPDHMPCRWSAITKTAPREREGVTHPTALRRRWVEKSSTSRPVAQARRNPLAERQKPRPKRSQYIAMLACAPYCDVVWGNKIIALRFETYFANLVGQHIAPFP